MCLLNASDFDSKINILALGSNLINYKGKHDVIVHVKY